MTALSILSLLLLISTQCLASIELLESDGQQVVGGPDGIFMWQNQSIPPAVSLYTSQEPGATPQTLFSNFSDTEGVGPPIGVYDGDYYTHSTVVGQPGEFPIMKFNETGDLLHRFFDPVWITNGKCMDSVQGLSYTATVNTAGINQCNLETSICSLIATSIVTPGTEIPLACHDGTLFAGLPTGLNVYSGGGFVPQGGLISIQWMQDDGDFLTLVESGSSVLDFYDRTTYQLVASVDLDLPNNIASYACTPGTVEYICVVATVDNEVYLVDEITPFGFCGDGITNGYQDVEECDDANVLNGDGCDVTCQEDDVTGGPYFGLSDGDFAGGIKTLGSWAYVGARNYNVDQGAIHAFQVNSETGDITDFSLLQSPDPQNELFGKSGAFDATEQALLVAAPWRGADSAAGEGGPGIAFLYPRSPDGSLGTPIEIPSPAPSTSNARFGYCAAVSDEWVVLSSPFEESERGALYVAPLVSTLSGQWNNTVTRLVIPSSLAGDRVGISCALSGDELLIGADGRDTGSLTEHGTAWLYRWSGSAWIEVTELPPPVPATEARAGFSVDISGDLAVVGAPAANLDGPGYRGAIYVYKRDDDGQFSSQGESLEVPVVLGAGFGEVVLIESPNRIFASGASSSAIPDRKGRVLEYHLSSSGSWALATELSSAQLLPSSAFGSSLGVVPGFLMVGAREAQLPGVPMGAIELFPLCGDSHIVLDEACDDGNLVDGDGCDSSCMIEEPSEPPFPWAVVGAGITAVILLSGFVCVFRTGQKSPNTVPTSGNYDPEKQGFSPLAPSPPSSVSDHGSTAAARSPPPARAPPAVPRTLSPPPPPSSSSKKGSTRSANSSRRQEIAIMTTKNVNESKAAQELVDRLNNAYADASGQVRFVHVQIPISKRTDEAKRMLLALLNNREFIFMGTAWGYGYAVGDGGRVKHIYVLNRVDVNPTAPDISPNDLDKHEWSHSGDVVCFSGPLKVNNLLLANAIASGLETKSGGVKKFLGDMESDVVADLGAEAIFRVAVDLADGTVSQKDQLACMRGLSNQVFDYVGKRFGLVDPDNPEPASVRGSHLLESMPLDLRKKLAELSYDSLVVHYGTPEPRGPVVNVRSVHNFIVKQGYDGRDYSPMVVAGLFQLVPGADTKALTQDDWFKLQTEINQTIP